MTTNKNIEIFNINSKKEYNFNEVFQNQNELLIFKQMYHLDPTKIKIYEDTNEIPNKVILLNNYSNNNNYQLIQHSYVPTKEEHLQLELYENNFKLNGWFDLDHYSKSLIKKKGNQVHCYVCMKMCNLEQIKYCRIVSKNLIKINNPDMDNLFVICNSCFIANSCVCAPRTYNDVCNHLQTLTSRYYDSKTKLFIINKKINNYNNQIEYYQNILNENIQSLNTLIEENNFILDNIEMEKKKNEDLKKIKNENKKNFRKIMQQYNTITNDINIMVNNTTNSFINMNSVVLNSRSMIQKELKKNLNTIESFAETTKTSNHICKICYNNKVNYALLPCGHTLCKECSTIISSEENVINNYQTPKCPFCKQNITSYQKIFLD